MKKTNLKNLKTKNILLYNKALNESNYLINLINPNIIKYYTNFTKGDFLYNIMESETNSNLENYISANKLINKPFKEEQLWIIFLQCMQGLEYFHEKGVIHRNIRAENILMDNNKIIKIGYFGIYSLQNRNDIIQYKNATYRKPINLNNINNIQQENFSKEITEYDQKIDVYYMGNIFYEMCYFRKPDEFTGIYVNGVNYSNKLLRIINDMLEKDTKKRKNSKYFLMKIKEEFFQKI